MRILMAPGALAGIEAAVVAAVAGEAWWAAAPHDEVRLVPLSDGGPGMVGVVRSVLGGHDVTVPGALPDGPPARVLVVEPADGPPTAVVEAATGAGGPAGAPVGQRSSAALGVLVAEAARLAPRVVVGLGGALTLDAGAGLLAGLGLPGERLALGGDVLGELSAADLDGLGALRERFTDVQLEVAVDTDVPLLGLAGASAVLAPTLGISAPAAQAHERAFGRWVALLGEVLGPGAVRAAAARPGAGAGGGLAFALAALGATLRPGAELTADLLGLGPATATADLVLTAASSFDAHVLHDSPAATAARHGLHHGVPVVAFADQVLSGRRQWAAAGFCAVHPLRDGIGAPVGGPIDVLSARVGRLARTWSR